jgi:hypothetical protein
MLVNEFVRFEEIFLPGDWFKQSATDVDEAADQICKAWEKAAFSELPDHSIRRYFQYQLEGISKFSDTLYEVPDAERAQHIQLQLLGLIDRLFRYHLPEINPCTTAPLAYQNRLIGELRGDLDLWITRLHSAPVSPALKDCLTNWLKLMINIPAELRFSFRFLNYFRKLSAGLLMIEFTHPDIEEQLTTMLSQYNFNHLNFLIYRQQAIRQKSASFDRPLSRLGYLQERKAEILVYPEIMEDCYDPSWPSLKIMLAAWVQEQINLAEFELKKELELKSVVVTDKQLVNISVAHLACLIRLFLEENVLASQNTRNVIQFFSTHFRTKKQAAISAGSLSKEFYSIDQHTAARVRDLLQKMVQRLNRNFFPAVAVIGTTALAYPGIY